MTLALRWLEDENDETKSSFLYFNAVTAFSQTYGGKVTEHPISVGASVTDHYIRNNPSFRLSGVFTRADISSGTFLIQDINGQLPFNRDELNQNVSVNEGGDSLLRKFLPDSLGQFIPVYEPVVTVQEGRLDLIEQIREMIVQLVSGDRFNELSARFDSNIQLVSLYEYSGNLLSKITNNLVLTNLDFRETPDTGSALYCDMTFSQVKFTTQKKEAIPADVANSLKKKATPKATKGKQDSTVQNTATGKNPPKDVDPLRGVAEEL